MRLPVAWLPRLRLRYQSKSEDVRNWDYRFCWLRDAAFILLALMRAGYREEAKPGAQWLLRAIAGSPAQMQTIYGVRGERRLDEFEIPWLSGYENSRPVRIGNAASNAISARRLWRDPGRDVGRLIALESKWKNRNGHLMVQLMKFLESNWQKPDEGIWEVRGGRKHFTHSKMMAWVAFDCAIKLVEECGCAARRTL